MVKSLPGEYPALLAFKKKLELPMLGLSFFWLCILIVELAYGTDDVLSGIGTGIWIVFVLYFGLCLISVANRLSYLKKNWLFVLAILVSILRFFPPLQVFPAVRVVTATFGLQVVWIFASADQGMRSLRRALGRRGAGYAIALTIVVIFAGAAGTLHFEGVGDDVQGIHTYPKALWWAAMQMTNIGSSYSFKTTGGRVVCLGVSIYAAGMFGYLTALFATFLIDREAKDVKPELARQKSIQEIELQIVRLREFVEEIVARLPEATRVAKGEEHAKIPHA